MTAPPAWALARVPGLERGERARRVERLRGGSVNQVFRIDSAAGRFVLRLDGAAWRRPGVDRDRELVLHRAAAAAGIAPSIVHAGADAGPRAAAGSRADADEHGVLVMEYLEGRVWDSGDYEDADSLRRLGERLQVLHRLSAPGIAAFHPWQVAQGYVRRIAPARLPSLQAPLRRLEALSGELARESVAVAVVHGDLWQGNVLDGSRLWLLDWEYAQRTDPLMDVACVLAYYPRAERHRAELAAAAGFDAGAVREALSERVHAYRVLTWLWHLARGEDAEAP